MTYLGVHQTENLVIDIPAANAELMGVPYHGFKELLEDFVGEPGFDGPLKYEDGKLLIAKNEEHTFDGYADEYVSVWSCIGDREAKIISKHISEGKLVLRLDPEGYDSEFYLIKPDSVVKKTVSDLSF